jgi:hypothetical protein
VLIAAGLDMKYKTSELASKKYDQLNELRTAQARAEMYISLDHRVEFNSVFDKLGGVVREYVGPEKPLLPSDTKVEIISLASKAETRLRSQIKDLAKL